MMTATPTKRCSCCKQAKPLSDFQKNRSTKDGYHTNCRTCKNKNSSAFLSSLRLNDVQPQIKINGLTFIQHRSSVLQINEAIYRGEQPPQPIYAWYGGKKLTEAALLASVRMLQTRGII